MKALTIENAEEMILALQDEIRRTDESRYDHRLHGVLLVAHGLSARETAGLLGDSPRAVEYWVRDFNEHGFAGLTEVDRPGRPTRLSAEQFEKLEIVLRKSPRDCGLEVNLWDGKALAFWLKQNWGAELSVRQCQRIFRRLGFRQRKPRPMIAQADKEAQRAHKKTPGTGSKQPH